jgi:hypothetical protein
MEFPKTELTGVASKCCHGGGREGLKEDMCHSGRRVLSSVQSAFFLPEWFVLHYERPNHKTRALGKMLNNYKSIIIK